MKNLKFYKYTLTVTTLFCPSLIMAQTCTTPPSCDTLGYKQTAADCSGQQMLKCPFDNSKVFCGGAACAADFKLSSCDTSIGNYTSCGGKCKYTSCKTGWYLNNGNCVPNACEGYKYGANKNCASYTTCKKGASTVYKCTACNNCYILSYGYCDVVYTSNGNQNAETYQSCTEGGITKYNPTTCKSGYMSCSFSDDDCETWYNKCIPWQSVCPGVGCPA